MTTTAEMLTECMDDFMRQIQHQKVVDSSRVLDFCLDLRQLVLREEKSHEEVTI